MSAASSVSYAQAAMGHASSKEERSPPEQQLSAHTASANDVDGQNMGAGSDDGITTSNATSELDNTSSTVIRTPLGEHPEMDGDDGPASTDTSSLDGDKTSTTSVNTHIPHSDVSVSATQNDEKSQPADSDSTTNGPTADSDGAKEATKVELMEAPVPQVNVWQQRREAQMARVKNAVSPLTSTTAETGNVSTIEPRLGPHEQRRSGRHAVDKESFGTGTQATGSMTSHGGRQRKGEPSRADSDSSRRNAPSRGAKMSDRESENAGSTLTIATAPTAAAPPPVDDASLWPTLDGASKEERRRMSEKAERTEKENGDDGSGMTSFKPRASRGWRNVELDYRAIFPPPASQPRSSRGRGGARGGSRVGQPHPQGQVQSQLQGHGQAQEVSDGSTHGNATQDKASAVATASTSKIAIDTTGAGREREREKDRGRANTGDGNGPISTTAPAGSHPIASTSRRATADGVGNKEGRKATAATSMAERSRDSPINGASGHSQHTRDRAEGRSERGRGGFRGRGGHHGATGSHAHGAGAGAAAIAEFKLQTNLPNRPPAQFSPQTKQNGFGMLPPSHGSNGHPQSHANSHGHSRPRGGHRSGAASGAHNRTSSQQVGISAHHGHPAAHPYDYPMQTPMSNMPTYPVGPYSPALAPEGFALLKAQLEYYFSVDNLCKDLYLRTHMDTQGFVPLPMIAQFKRLRDITDDLDVLGNACEDSAKLEIVSTSNGTELVRPSNDWRPFVLPMSDRKPSAQHDGPTELVFRSRLLVGNQWYPAAMGYPATPTGVVYGNGMVDHQFRVEPVHRPNGTGTISGIMNHMGASHVPDTPLSASVSEFSPGALASSHSMLPNSRAVPFIPAGQDGDLSNYGAMVGGAFNAPHLPTSSFTIHEKSKPSSAPANGFPTIPAAANAASDGYQGA